MPRERTTLGHEDYKRIDEEAQRVAKAAVAALHQAARKPKSRLKELGFSPTKVFVKIT